MRVRTVEVSELAALRELRLRALADAPGAFGSTHAEEADRDPQAWRAWVVETSATFVAEDGAGWHGLAVGHLDGEQPALAHVFSMWVAPEHRGGGVGRRLLEAAVAWAWDRGAVTVRLGAAEANDAAHALYARFGFEPTGECEPLRSDPSRRCDFLELGRPTG